MVRTRTHKTPDHPSEQQADRDPKGRFLRGNRMGRQFQQGQSGNPRGRPPNAGASIKERQNTYFDFDDLTRVDLQTVVDDPASHPGDVIAAQAILDACRAGTVGREARDHLINHLDGRPTKTTHVSIQPQATAADLLAEARRMIPSTFTSSVSPPTDDTGPR